MRKKYKKLVLSLGVLSLATIPLVSVIACGSSSKTDNEVVNKVKGMLEKLTTTNDSTIPASNFTQNPKGDLVTFDELALTPPTDFMGTTVIIKAIGDIDNGTVKATATITKNKAKVIANWTISGYQNKASMVASKDIESIANELKKLNTTTLSKTLASAVPSGLIPTTDWKTKLGINPPTDFKGVNVSLTSNPQPNTTVVVSATLNKSPGIGITIGWTISGYLLNIDDQWKNMNAATNALYQSKNITETSTSIPELTFKGIALPEGFFIPSNITSIGNNAFEESTLPNGFTLPNSITSIGNEAFEVVNIPTGFELPINSQFTILNNRLFFGSTLPEGFFIPQNITSVKDWSIFEHSTFASDFTMINNNSITTYDVSLFEGSNLSHATDFSLPSQIRTIPWSTFMFAQLPDNFNLVHLPIQTILKWGFAGIHLPLNFRLPNTLTSIGIGAFENSYLPPLFKIPNGVTSIDETAFNNIHLPDGYHWSNSAGAVAGSQVVPNS